VKEYKNISMTRLVIIFAAGCINNLLYFSIQFSLFFVHLIQKGVVTHRI